MTEFVYVKPNGGRVRMPDRGSKIMPPEGAMVPRIDYYERLIIGGDVAIGKPPPEPRPEAKSAPPPPPPDPDIKRR